MIKGKQAEAAAITGANIPTYVKELDAEAANKVMALGAKHWVVKPKLPPRHRPRRLQCPVCSFPFVVKKRGPISETCSRQCARALALYKAYRRGQQDAQNMPVELLKDDIRQRAGLLRALSASAQDHLRHVHRSWIVRSRRHRSIPHRDGRIR